MRKTTYLLSRIVLLILFLFTGCVRRDYKYIYLKPRIQVYNTFDERKILSSETLSFNHQFFSVALPADEFSASNLLSSFSNTAYAFQPAKSAYIPAENITDIKLICLEDYNGLFKAGSDIMDSCVFVATQLSNSDDDRYPIPLTGPGYEYSKQEVLDRLNSAGWENNITGRISFFIKTKPSALGTQQFAIVFTTDQSARISDTTIRYKLMP